jgi:tetratricopeptide (TPR) repeat protein
MQSKQHTIGRNPRLAATLLVAVFLTASSAAQNLPAGTESYDQAKQAAEKSNAASQQMHAAEDALERHDYAAAEKTLTALAASQPNNAQILFDLGFAQEAQNKDAEAAKSYAASATADPKLAEPRVSLGLLYARTGHPEDAHRLLLEATQIDTAVPALRGRALRALAALDETAHPDQAREELIAAIQLTGETPQDLKLTADLAAGAATTANDWADAEAAYRRVLASDPNDLLAIAGLGHVLQHENKLADADTLLSAAAAQHPDNAPLIAQLASVKAAEGKTTEAIAAVEQLRKLSPAAATAPATTRLLARLYSTDENYEAAEALYTQLLAATPNDPLLLDALGSAQVKHGEYAAAEATLKKAVALRSSFADEADWAEAASHLAFAASKNNDPAQTLQALAARATVLPNSPASLFLEATAHDTLHQTKEAERAYRAFLAAANGKFPDQEFQARHRLVALEHIK